jgi:hypothetical protein
VVSIQAGCKQGHVDMRIVREGGGLLWDNTSRARRAARVMADSPGARSARAWVTSPSATGEWSRCSRRWQKKFAALDFELPAELRQKLNEVSAQPPPFPYGMFTDAYQAWILKTGASVDNKPPGYAPAVWSKKA